MTLTGAGILLGSLGVFLLFMAVRTILLGMFRERVLQFLFDEGIGNVVPFEVVARNFPRRKVLRELRFLSNLDLVLLHHDEGNHQYWKLTPKGRRFLSEPS